MEYTGFNTTSLPPVECIESVSAISVPINPYIYSDCQSSSE